ncbi:PDZ domain-containing protein [Atlantibacter hermannii]|uniref:PDZ domain-containing protein n=1 Tax=Atlantibacter hermannii TaxID=565 RepID=UPI00289DB5B7|nr:PDZ domain-containing protein [Atlantibacter hermannii]
MKRAFVFVLGFLLSGCVSQSVRNQQQDEINQTIPSCSSQRQCDAAWAAARQWVTQNCGMKIQNYSNDYIETYNSIGNSTNTSCQVTKNPHPNGVNSINITVSCANMFGCTPDQYQSVIEFNKYVGEVVNNFSPIKIGAMMGMADKNGKVVENPSYSAGLVISDIESGSSASKAGLLVGDIVTSVGDDRIRTQADMTEAMGKYHSGDSVKFKIIRRLQESFVNINL